VAEPLESDPQKKKNKQKKTKRNHPPALHKKEKLNKHSNLQ
jgi:hypothetical protein